MTGCYQNPEEVEGDLSMFEPQWLVSALFQEAREILILQISDFIAFLPQLPLFSAALSTGGGLELLLSCSSHRLPQFKDLHSAGDDNSDAQVCFPAPAPYPTISCRWKEAL